MGRQDMGPSLHLEIQNRRCFCQDARDIPWGQDLPSAWETLVVAPLRFDVFQEYEMPADRTLGYDEDGAPCYCAFRFILTALKSDDGEMFYEAPDHNEALTAWRLRDKRWLIYREVVADLEQGVVQGFFSFSNAMPR